MNGGTKVKTIIILCSLLMAGSAANAAQTLREITWDVGKAAAGEVIPADKHTPFAQLKIANDKPTPVTVTFLTIDTPGITDMTYAVTGKVRYENVEGQGYLEMWNVFPDGSRFFSRGLGGGEMSPIEGTSGWRTFMLPFDMTGADEKPKQLVLNLVLPGKGTVYIGPITLVQPASAACGGEERGRWWHNQAEGWIGALGGLIGGLGGLLGALTGWLAPRGKGRRFIIAGWYAFLGIGVSALIAGLVALSQHQPYGVFYPLLLCGVLFTVLAAVLIPGVRKRYDDYEFRKMRAEDAGIKC